MQNSPKTSAPAVPEQERVDAKTTRYRPPEPHDLDEDIRRVQKSWHERWSKK